MASLVVTGPRRLSSRAPIMAELATDRCRGGAFRRRFRSVLRHCPDEYDNTNKSSKSNNGRTSSNNGGARDTSRSRISSNSRTDTRITSSASSSSSRRRYSRISNNSNDNSPTSPSPLLVREDR